VQTNRYVEAFLIAGAMCLVAAFLILTIRPRAETARAADLLPATS